MKFNAIPRECLLVVISIFLTPFVFRLDILGVFVAYVTSDVLEREQEEEEEAKQSKNDGKHLRRQGLKMKVCVGRLLKQHGERKHS